MRVVLTALVVMGCASVSSKPLSPDAPAAEPPPVAHLERTSSAAAPEPAASSAPAEHTEAAAEAPAAARAQPSPAAEESGLASKGTSKVQLLNAGSEPRKALRYVFHRGESMKFRMHQDMTMQSEISTSGIGSTLATQTVRTILPTTECDGVTRTRQLDADGTAHRDGFIANFKTLSTPGVEPAVQAKMQEVFHGLGKLPFDDVINTRGELLEYHLDLSSVQDATLHDSMQQLTDSLSGLLTPWPVEAVGVGAKWQSQGTLSLAGGQFTRTTTVTLTSLRGARLKLDVAVQLLGAPYSVVKNGMSVEIGETRTSSLAHAEVVLDPMTTQAKGSGETRTESTASGAHVQMQIHTETVLYSGP